MKSILTLLLLSLPALHWAAAEHPTLAIGSPAPGFSLPATDGKTYQLSSSTIIVLTLLPFIYSMTKYSDRCVA